MGTCFKAAWMALCIEKGTWETWDIQPGTAHGIVEHLHREFWDFWTWIWSEWNPCIAKLGFPDVLLSRDITTPGVFNLFLPPIPVICRNPATHKQWQLRNELLASILFSWESAQAFFPRSLTKCWPRFRGITSFPNSDWPKEKGQPVLEYAQVLLDLDL